MLVDPAPSPLPPLRTLRDQPLRQDDDALEALPPAVMARWMAAPPGVRPETMEAIDALVLEAFGWLVGLFMGNPPTMYAFMGAGVSAFGVAGTDAETPGVGAAAAGGGGDAAGGGNNDNPNNPNNSNNLPPLPPAHSPLWARVVDALGFTPEQATELATCYRIADAARQRVMAERVRIAEAVARAEAEPSTQEAAAAVTGARGIERHAQLEAAVSRLRQSIRKEAVTRNLIGMHLMNTVNLLQLAAISVVAYPFFPMAWPMVGELVKRQDREAAAAAAGVSGARSGSAGGGGSAGSGGREGLRTRRR
jgi:hypothetical protein